MNILSLLLLTEIENSSSTQKISIVQLDKQALSWEVCFKSIGFQQQLLSQYQAGIRCKMALGVKWSFGLLM
ncbi:4765_t:CDS:2, partial [Dentiscutata erythropus]